MSEPKIGSRVWLEINLETLKQNYAKIRDAVKPSEVIAVLKADAYGLGNNIIAEALAEVGVAGFGVAQLSEAMQMVHLGKPVMVLGAILPSSIPTAVQHGIILPVNDLETARQISEESIKQNKTTECHFLIDTGMGRLGILLEQAEQIITETVKLPGLNCCGMYSHFPVAYQGGCEITEKQVASFIDLLEKLDKKNITFEKIHIANSDAINNFPYTYRHPFNFVRTGINLHGSFDSEGQRVLELKSTLTLKTRLMAVRTLPAGMSIGYGCTYKLLKDTQVGTIGAGYADGLPLALSNRGYVLINDCLCPVLGRVSMDYTTVSLESVPDAQCGDEVICLGGEGINAITVDYWAQIKGTHPYDIICSFGHRVDRRYV